MQKITPVSYTHLDVYKRQVYALFFAYNTNFSIYKLPIKHYCSLFTQFKILVLVKFIFICKHETFIHYLIENLL